MFTSNELLHLVFADPMDEYYCKGLLKLDLPQYLWVKLHEKYSTVYYLSAKDRAFSVSTMGDLMAKPYEESQSLFHFFGKKNEADRFGSWMIAQLKAKRKEAVAFVCSAEIFCRVMRENEWLATLQAMAAEKNRTGIIVLLMPMDADKSRNLLINNPVFSILGDAGILDVRSGALRGLLPALKESKSDACALVAPCSGETIHDLLIHLQMENPDYLLSKTKFERVESYLTKYLSDISLQVSEPLFFSKESSLYLSFRDLYINLKDCQTWNRLVERAERDQTSCLQQGKSRRIYSLPRDRNSVLGRCAQKLYAEASKYRDEKPSESARLEALAFDLYNIKNCTENASVSQELKSFLEFLPDISKDDCDSYSKLILAINSCVDWMFIPQESEEEQNALSLIKKLRTNIELSLLKHRTVENIATIQPYSKGKLAEKRLVQLQEQANTLEQSASQYQKLIDDAISGMLVSSFSKEILNKMNLLEKSIAEIDVDEPAKDSSKLKTEGEGKTGEETDEEEIYLSPEQIADLYRM